ncbi:hypothetical protein ACED51_20935 [Photobacterium swingsii]|uniref:hypothetical protein n=1 Tax=Photobacterium swingsii TaxID=680026 RepID=UPI00352F87E3
MPTNQHTEEAPLWVLPLAILVILALQLAVSFEDAQHQKINTLHGETLQLWQASEQAINTAPNNQGRRSDNRIVG